MKKSRQERTDILNMYPKTYKSFLYRYSIFFIIISAACVAFLSSVIYLYSDDVYYASFLKGGFENFINLNIQHYLTVNGRVMVHVLDEIILFLGKQLFIIINPVMILGFCILSSKCLNLTTDEGKEKIYICAAAALFFIMCLPVEITNESVYWITGSMNYTLPALLCICMYYLLKTNIKSGKSSTLLLIACFVCAATTEQGAVLAFCISVLIVMREKPDNWRIFHLAPILCMAGALSIFLSPGTFLRLSYTGGAGIRVTAILKFMLQNLAPLSVYLTGKGGINAILSVLILSTAYISYRQKRTSAFFISGVLICVLLIYQRIFKSYNTEICILSAVLSCVYLALWGVYAFKNPQYCDCGVFLICAVILLCFMLISPVLGTRVVLIPSFILAAAAGRLCLECFENAVFSSAVFFCAAAAILPIWAALAVFGSGLIILIKKSWRALFMPAAFFIFIFFFTPVAQGYYHNYNILKNNEENIAAAKISGQLCWDIDLKDPYRHRMFYENSDFMPYFLTDKGLSKSTEVYLISSVHKPIYFEGVRLKAPSVQENTLYYPLRDIFETAGGKVLWDGKTQAISVIFKSDVYTFYGERYIAKQGKDTNEEILLDYKKQTYFCRTYVPESFVENFFEIENDRDSIRLYYKK